MFKKTHLKHKHTISKKKLGLLHEEHENLKKKYNKLNRRIKTITKLNDKQLFKQLNENIEHSRINKRFKTIIKHSDRQGIKILNQKSDLEIALEKELENERVLIKEIEDTQKEVVYTMGAIGETRSQETGQHVKRVAQYSYLLAKYYGLSEEEANILMQASPMHDIGKVAIADSILNKPAKLTDIEFERMKEHSLIGYDMLKHSTRPLLKAAAIVACEHHEKFDGTGYPKGAYGDNIHVYGRITALADVFDALGSDRVYKKAWKDEEVFKFIRNERAKHFDPKLVDIFFNNLNKFLEIRDKFKDK